MPRGIFCPEALFINVKQLEMCYQPITIKTPQGYRQVPCGKCLECLRKYQSDWSNRMYEELKAHNGKAVFFTLTYDDNNVPKNYLYYASATDYEIFRSPSDYGYDNTYTDEAGRKKVLPSRKGERKHERVDPSVELRATGLDPKIIDFNVQRKEQEKFRDTIQNIYGNYLRTIIDDSDSPEVCRAFGTYSTDSDFDFWNYNGDYFGIDEVSDSQLQEDTELVLDLFTEFLNDDDYENPEKEDKGSEDKVLDDPYVVRTEKAFGSTFRERPVMQFNSVRKKDIQDWIKRARQRRKRLSKKEGKPEQQFTFYITSEYGPRTLRPHYHGVIFGITAEEGADMRADWQRHHGQRISWENVDLSKGDMSYCAKYCSKGFYEHPLCSKDFFYKKSTTIDGNELRPFTEYHSKHYERCMEIFGIDAPIVDPTFHLVSKGLGIKWVEDHKDIVKDFQDIEFKDGEADSTIKVVYNPIDFPLPWEDTYQPFIEKYGKEEYDRRVELFYSLDDLKGIQDEQQHILHRQNKEEKTKDYEECIERLFNRFKYFRTYKTQVIAYGVPKYYRTKIFSDGLRAAFTNYVQQVNVRLYQEKFDAIRAEDATREDTEIVLMLERQDQKERYERMNNCKKKLDKLYNKSKI